MNNPNVETYKSAVDMEQFGVWCIDAWYERVTEARTSAQDLVLSLLSDVQHFLGDSGNEHRVQFMINRIKWITLNKLDNK